MGGSEEIKDCGNHFLRGDILYVICRSSKNAIGYTYGYRYTFTITDPLAPVQGYRNFGTTYVEYRTLQRSICHRYAIIGEEDDKIYRSSGSTLDIHDYYPSLELNSNTLVVRSKYRNRVNDS